ELEFEAGSAKPVVELFKKYMPEGVAISDDCLAGVVVHDEWFREDGVRAVYITFEAEASSDDAAWNLMENSIVWASEFKYRAQEVTKEVAELVEEMKGKGAAAATPTPMPSPTPPTPTPTPGFEAVLAIAGLSAACLMMLRSRRRRAE
ncbi:MAG: PGF-CTERM sorting domain-containing protein, partial [Candidatus Alkanophagales archaeon]